MVNSYNAVESQDNELHTANSGDLFTKNILIDRNFFARTLGTRNVLSSVLAVIVPEGEFRVFFLMQASADVSALAIRNMFIRRYHDVSKESARNRKKSGSRPEFDKRDQIKVSMGMFSFSHTMSQSSEHSYC